MNRFLRSLLALLLLASASAHAADRGPLVLAAASMQEALNAAADDWATRGHRRPLLSFAGSSALARQILAGSPADLFISADQQWMDSVEKAGFVARGSRATWAGNRLVLIAPANSAVRLTIAPRFPLARAIGKGRLAMADPDSVPAGRYGKAALTRLGVWGAVEPRVARADNVRAALALVESGAAPLGIVYATDARASRLVRVVALFPVSSHPPIRYPVARLARSAHGDAEPFRRFLLSPRGRGIIARFGFTAP